MKKRVVFRSENSLGAFILNKNKRIVSQYAQASKQCEALKKCEALKNYEVSKNNFLIELLNLNWEKKVQN